MNDTIQNWTTCENVFKVEYKDNGHNTKFLRIDQYNLEEKRYVKFWTFTTDNVLYVSKIKKEDTATKIQLKLHKLIFVLLYKYSLPIDAIEVTYHWLEIMTADWIRANKLKIKC